jgi:hypothetical protein
MVHIHLEQSSSSVRRTIQARLPRYVVFGEEDEADFFAIWRLRVSDAKPDQDQSVKVRTRGEEWLSYHSRSNIANLCSCVGEEGPALVPFCCFLDMQANWITMGVIRDELKRNRFQMHD